MRFVDWANSMGTLARDKVMRANIEVVETVAGFHLGGFCDRLSGSIKKNAIFYQL